MDLTHADPEELEAAETACAEAYDAIKAEGLKLDMTRGKPSAEQLALSDPMLTIVDGDGCHGAGGTDYRNYGIVEGISEARALFADYMDVTQGEIIVGGNASLTMMYDAFVGALLFGMPGGDGPWRAGRDKIIAPVPGYDRHFAICERLGLEMLPVDMLDDGPDMDAVEAMVADDASIKGIWCVPKYSNPTGAVYSDETVERLAAMKTAAPDFRIFWDNAYNVHHIVDGGPADVLNVLSACEDEGTADRPLMFGSTSKMTHPGSGVALMAASEDNIADAVKKISYASIGPDKINQLRHVRLFKDMDGILAHMAKHADIVRPRFKAVDDALAENLEGKGIAQWTRPDGGYFTSVDVMDDCATEVVRLAAEAGVKFTPAGATFPLGKDPRDRNLRLAPTMPDVAEVEAAMRVFCTCVELVSVRKLLGKNR